MSIQVMEGEVYRPRGNPLADKVAARIDRAVLASNPDPIINKFTQDRQMRTEEIQLQLEEMLNNSGALALITQIQDIWQGGEIKAPIYSPSPSACEISRALVYEYQDITTEETVEPVIRKWGKRSTEELVMEQSIYEMAEESYRFVIFMRRGKPGVHMRLVKTSHEGHQTESGLYVSGPITRHLIDREMGEDKVFRATESSLIEDLAQESLNGDLPIDRLREKAAERITRYGPLRSETTRPLSVFTL